MAKKRRQSQAREAADPLAVLGDMRAMIPVHPKDMEGPIYTVVLDPRGGSSSRRRGKTGKKAPDKPIVIINVGNGGRCVKHEFEEVVYYVCGGTES